LADAAAARSGGPALDWMPVLPPVEPELTTTQLSQALCRTWLGETSSSSATSIPRPVVTPFPISIWLVLNVTVLSALMVSHESTWLVGGRYPAEVGAVAAPALPAVAAPASEKPTISAPPPLRNDLRENSLLRISVIFTSHPSPSQRRPSGSP
jgi:hypothetical protein